MMSVATPDAPAVARSSRGGDGFASSLRRYRTLVTPTIHDALPRGEPREYLYDPIRSYFEPVGKGLRPALCIATCLAFGGRAERALVSAAALEILHTAVLVHDDIEE